MIRIAVIAPPSQGAHYTRAAVRTDAFEMAVGVNASSFSASQQCADVESLLTAADSFDACVVHRIDEWAKWTQSLVELDKHVLLDDSLVDLSTLAEISTWAGGRVAIAQPQRFSSYAQTLSHDLTSGRLGVPGLVRIHRWLDAKPKRVESHLWGALTREIDLACWFLDATPDRVFAQPHPDASQGCQVHLGFEDAMALVDVAYAGNDYYAASVIGSRGAAYADDHHNTNLLLAQRPRGILVSGDSDDTRFQLEHFAAWVSGKREDSSIQDAARAISVGHAAVQAAQQSRPAMRDGDHYALA